MKIDPHTEISQFVTFMVKTELFGVLIQSVEEIIIPPEKITPVPKAPHYFSGMINLRGEVISVIDLRLRFNLAASEKSNATRIMIVSIEGMKIGMVVDSVARVLPIHYKDVRPPPAIMHHSNSKYIFGSVQMENSVLMLLDTDALIDSNEMTLYKHRKSTEESAAGTALQVARASEEKILIGFKLRHENYALDINHVEEIIELPKITAVPEMDQLIEGIFHQRDRALPILRLSRRFRMPDAVLTEDNPVLIVNGGGLVIGFIVDEITEVFRVQGNDIVPPPSNISGRSAEQLDGIIKIKKDKETQVVMALNLSKILNEEEQEYIKELNEGLNDMVEEMDNDEDSSEVISILKFRVGEEVFAIRLPEINEITTMQKMVSVPKSPPFVNGVINLRGDVITIIDLSKMFGNAPSVATDMSRIVIVAVEDQKAGFQVDQILGIDHLPISLFEKPSNVIRGQYNRFVEGIGREPQHNQVIILMDTREALMQSADYEGDWGQNLLEAPEVAA